MDVILNKILVGGFTNIGQVSIDLNDLSSLVAPNNYGKSNVLKAVMFAFDFIKAVGNDKIALMNRRLYIPINKHMADAPFVFEVTGTLSEEDGDIDFEYGFKFEWAKTYSTDGARIIEEHLRFRKARDGKYKQYINREKSDEALYQPTETSRCNRQLPLDGNILALEKLAYYDDLFFVEKIRSILSISVQSVNTLDNPDDYFSGKILNEDISGYSLAFPKPSQIGYFVNSLQHLDPDRYELLKDTIMSLLPNIEDFTPVQVDLRGTVSEAVPYQLPNIFYDIRIKEKNNNQPTSIASVSTGCKKILLLVVMLVAADINNVPLLMFEELENSVHPRLLQNILLTVAALSGNTKVLITSHSPYLVRFLPADRIYVGVPSEQGIADFRTIRSTKVKKLARQAAAEEVTLGEYLFELMLDMEDNSEIINEYF